MSVRHVFTIIAILLVAVAAVGLILCRPMAAENYGTGDFSFENVTEAQVRAYTNTEGVPVKGLLTIDTENRTLRSLIDEFDGRGFGRTPGSVVFEPDPELAEGDRYFLAAFYCATDGSRLTVEGYGDDIIFIGADKSQVITQDGDEWTRDMYDLIFALYPKED